MKPPQPATHAAEFICGNPPPALCSPAESTSRNAMHHPALDVGNPKEANREPLQFHARRKDGRGRQSWRRSQSVVSGNGPGVRASVFPLSCDLPCPLCRGPVNRPARPGTHRSATLQT